MPSPNKRKEQKIIKKIHAIQKKRDTLALKESDLFLKETKLWYELKVNFFRHKKSESWASFLKSLGEPLYTVEFKVALYKKWFNELGYTLKQLLGINSRKLHRAIPYVHTKKDAEKVLGKARELSFETFLKWLKTMQ